MKYLEIFIHSFIREKEFQNFTVVQSNSPFLLINHNTARYGKNEKVGEREIREN